ncbi:pyridoxal-phosphate dependent enzyme, partial [Chloroflexota bacterium]
VGCVGGGSNFAGMFLPWVRDKISGKKPDLRIICAEPQACPTITKGLYAWDYGDIAGLAPIVLMHTLGHGFIPPPVHAGGLRYHGMAPIICHLHKLGFVEAQALKQIPVFEAAVTFARTEGIMSAPETSHAIRVAIDEAIKCKKEGKSKTILIAHSGHGHFDLAAYDEYLSGRLQDYEYPEEKVKEALASLPKVPEG